MQKVISILLTILILASSSGITYAKHFCGDFEVLSTLTMGKKDLSCGMAMEADDCDNNEEEPIDCCKNTYKNIDTDDNFVNSSFDLQINNNFIASFVSVFVLQDVNFSDKEIHLFNGYYPPPIYEDIQVLHQVFII
jgi:hypothetical protein